MRKILAFTPRSLGVFGRGNVVFETKPVYSETNSNRTTPEPTTNFPDLDQGLRLRKPPSNKPLEYQDRGNTAPPVLGSHQSDRVPILQRGLTLPPQHTEDNEILDDATRLLEAAAIEECQVNTQDPNDSTSGSDHTIEMNNESKLINDLKSKFEDSPEILILIETYVDEINKLKLDPKSRKKYLLALVFATGFMNITLMPATLKLTILSQLRKTLLVITPIIFGALLRPFTGKYADRHGGKNAIMAVLITSLVAMGGLTTYTLIKGEGGLNDIGDDNHIDQAILALLGLLAGFGGSSFSAIVAETAFSGKDPKDKASDTALTTGLGNTSPGASLMILSLLLTMIKLGYANAIWLAASLLGTVITGLKLDNSIYHQLIKLGVPKSDARKLATTLGQVQLPPETDTSIFNDLTLRGFTKEEKQVVVLLALNYFATFGSFLAGSVNFGPQLINKGFNPQFALFLAGAFSFIASLARYMTGKSFLASKNARTIINKWGPRTCGDE